MKKKLCVSFVVAALLTMSVHAERAFSVREWAGRDWPRVLLNYDIEAGQGEFVKGKTELVDGEGNAVQH